MEVSVLLFIVRRTFLSYFTLGDTSSFATRSVQLIFSILLQHHISELPLGKYITFIDGTLLLTYGER